MIEGSIKLAYVPTDCNVAESLTKGVTRDKLNFCNNEMGFYAHHKSNGDSIILLHLYRTLILMFII